MGATRGDFPDFGGQVVAAFESRRTQEMAALITKHGGVPLVAPCIREIPLEENPAAAEFADQLLAGRVDAAIFLTGSGARTLLDALERQYGRDRIIEALSRVVVVARGPKPAKALRERGVPITVSVREPHTWREILEELAKQPRNLGLAGSRVAVQEYGVPNESFLEALRARGARVLRVPVYRCALPEKIDRLREALEAILTGRARIVLWTNAAQVEHVFRVATQSGSEERLLEALRRCAVCSVGPTASEALAASGVPVDLEAEGGKMGMLVHQSARRAAELLRGKSQPVSDG
jgi:uroporphyrinogen-III synthase